MNRNTMQQKLFQFFLPQEAGAFRNNIEKEPQSPCQKLYRYDSYIISYVLYNIYYITYILTDVSRKMTSNILQHL